MHKTTFVKNGIITILLVITSAIYSQANLNFINPNEQYQLAEEAMNEENYKEAIELLSAINENDSIYRSAVLMTVQAWFYREKYMKVNELYKQYKNTKDDYFRQLSNYNGVALIRLEEFDKGIQFYQSLLKIYPKYYLYHFNLGKAYELAEQYEKAIEHYELSITYNAYYAPPHLALANMCYKNNQLAQALMAWDMYLLLNPAGANSIDVLIHANNAAAAKSEEETLNINISTDDEYFEEIDNLLTNYIALNKEYKVPTKIDVPFIKQNYALLEMLDGYEGVDGFWSKKYVPLLRKIHKNGFFEPFAYQMIQSSSTKSHQKAVTKSKKEREDFAGWFQVEWSKIIGVGNVANSEERYFYSSDGELVSIGSADENLIYNGEFNFYKSGRISAIGEFTNDKRSGRWTWYNEFAYKTEEVDYDSIGNPQGPHIKFDTSGRVTMQAYLSGQDYDGEYARYNNAYLTENGVYKNGEVTDSILYYYPLGKEYVQTVVYYKNGQPDGPIRKYFSNGALMLDATNVEGFRSGEEKHFFRNGQLSYLYNYDEGSLTGNYESYYQSGSLHQTGMFADDKRTGNWITYYTDETKMYDVNYVGGEFDGEYVFYDKGSKNPCYIYTYSVGDMLSYKHYNEERELFSEAVKPSSGDFLFESFYSDENKRAVGNFDKDGRRTGNWKFFDSYGNLESSEYYVEGVISGNDTSFYVNGGVYSITPYENGVMSGLSRSFFIDGSLLSMGNYMNGEQDRVWYYFYPDGQLQNKNFYRNGLEHGKQYEYAVDGKLYDLTYGLDGVAEYSRYFDTLGNIYTQVQYQIDSVGYLNFANGKKQMQYSYKNGIQHGEVEWYYESGQVNIRGSYFMGELEGKWEWYHENGQLREKGCYEEGNQVGEWISYHDNGQKNTIKQYDENNNLSGEYNTYNDKGVLTYSINYVDGEVHGAGFYYSDKGELQMVRYHNYGKVIGFSYEDENNALLPMIPIESGTAEVKTKYANGKPAREYAFDGGAFHGPYTHYYSNGQIETSETYYYGNRKGESVGYFEDGMLKYKTNYLLDQLHGTYIEYYKNGQVKQKENYVNGKTHGLAEYFTEEGQLEKTIWYFNGVFYDIIQN